MGKYFLFVLMMVAVVGCASESKEIMASYVSPLPYKHLTCDDIEAEVHRVMARATEVARMVDDRASEDGFKMAIGMFVFLPPLFFIEGDGPEATEYARLEGEYDALRKISIHKQCDIEIISPTRFDGEWVLVVDDLTGGSASNPVRILIKNHRWSAPFDTGAYAGEISGSVDERGNMIAQFEVAPSGHKSNVFRTSMTATYQQDAFVGQAHGWVWTHWKEFLVKLTKTAPELALWEAIKESDNAADYEAYLKQFPGGTYAAMAKARMVEAQRTGTEEAARKEAERKTAEEAKREAAEEAKRKEATRVSAEQAKAEGEAMEVEIALVASTLESFDGSWTAYHNGFTINLQIDRSSIEGHIDYSLQSAPAIRFKGRIGSDGRVNVWVGGGRWAKRKLAGTIPYLKLSRGGTLGGADFILKRVEDY